MNFLVIVLVSIATVMAAPRPDIADTFNRLIASSPKLQSVLGGPSSRCLESPQRGICRADFTRWAYNQKTNKCQTFTWGGCGESGNMFESEAECKRTCLNLLSKPVSCPKILDCPKPCSIRRNNVNCEECICKSEKPGKVSPDVCRLPSVSGFCRAAFPRFAYNSATGECSKFVYGGCGGNGNNFDTLEECKSVCM